MSCTSAILLAALTLGQASADAKISFRENKGKVEIELGKQLIGVLSYNVDSKTTRPYLHGLKTPGGISVTRNHPPIAGKDATDHDTMHPGLWLSFGDLSGLDYWRNKERVISVVKWLLQDKAELHVIHRYMGRGEDGIIALDQSRLAFAPYGTGYFILWESVFRPEANADNGTIVFGDQEEMGLGVRMATPLTVKGGGRIVNSDGLVNEKQVWGKKAKWCEYSGMIDGKRVGVTLMPHPDNFRRSWFHARDYGLLVANPFGQNAFTRGLKSAVRVTDAEPLRLKFGIYVFADDAKDKSSSSRAYDEYLRKETEVAARQPLK